MSNVSLIGKWLPSLSTSSRSTRQKAEMIRSALGWSPRRYRKTLSELRKRIDVVERKMSANQWGDINYEHVPSRAALNYRGAFRNHDEERYNAYLTNVKNGDAVIHSGMLFPHDIVHAYKDGYMWVKNIIDETLEAQWKALPNKVPADQSTLVVVDGSGSMGTRVGSTEITCHDVAQGLAIYFAEKLGGPYHNSFITFSSRPQYVQFADNMSLNARLRIMLKHTECSNTNIEKTFDLILDTAVKNHLRQDEIPANILIISDQEFDQGTGTGYYGAYHVTKSLFDQISDRWEAAGYKLPRLVYWNVCSRTGTIPVTNNDMGVALVSGFSPSIADMVMSAELDPYTCLVHKLLSGRYKMVEEVLRG